MIFNSNDRYKLLSRDGSVIKRDMKFITIIPAGYTLSEDECQKYFGASSCEVKLLRSRKDRYVFDKVVVPLPSPYFTVTKDYK